MLFRQGPFTGSVLTADHERATSFWVFYMCRYTLNLTDILQITFFFSCRPSKIVPNQLEKHFIIRFKIIRQFLNYFRINNRMGSPFSTTIQTMFSFIPIPHTQKPSLVITIEIIFRYIMLQSEKRFHFSQFAHGILC